MHRTRLSLFIAIAAMFAAVAPDAPANAAEPLSAKQIEAMEKVVEEYILAHPEIIVQAMEKLRARQKATEQKAIKRTLDARRVDLIDDPDSSFAGNPKGDVVMVEFFDYNCGVCKRVLPIVLRVLKDDPKVKLIYKEWPILGPRSVYASRAAIASRRQGKYVAFHNAMMASRGGLGEKKVMALAASVGLDTGRLKEDMKKPEIDRILKKNFDLGDALRLKGTPTFVIGDTLIGGGRNYETMRSIIQKARKKRRDDS